MEAGMQNVLLLPSSVLIVPPSFSVFLLLFFFAAFFSYGQSLFLTLFLLLNLPSSQLKFFSPSISSPTHAIHKSSQKFFFVWAFGFSVACIIHFSVNFFHKDSPFKFGQILSGQCREQYFFTIHLICEAQCNTSYFYF